jgi:hypothetical protein
VSWLRDAIRAEFDPSLLRAYLVALARAGQLDRDSAAATVARVASLDATVRYLRIHQDLPSLLDGAKRVKMTGGK